MLSDETVSELGKNKYNIYMAPDAGVGIGNTGVPIERCFSDSGTSNHGRYYLTIDRDATKALGRRNRMRAKLESRRAMKGL